LNLTHEESREKKYEFEMSWISEKTNFIHQLVPQNLIDSAVEKAVAAIEEDQMG
jgi:20S proteasome subunit alpha 7